MSTITATWGDWREWFAWYPVRAEDHRGWEKVAPVRWCWMCRMQRRKVWLSEGYDPSHMSSFYEYRAGVS